MNRWLTITVLFAAVTVLAGDRTFVKGVLTNVTVGQRTVGVPTSNGGTLIAQHNMFQVSVRVDDLIYTAETKSKDIREFTIGDPVDVSIDEKNVYLRSNGKEVKAKLLMKARASSQP